MSIVFLEGFDDGLWESRIGGTVTSTDVSSSYGLHGNGCRTGDISGRYLEVGILPDTLYTLGFAFNIIDADSSARRLVTFNLSFTGNLFIEYASGTNSLRLFIDDNTGDIDINTPNGSVSTGEWHYMEIQMKADQSSAGSYKWWLDGTLIGSDTGMDYVQSAGTQVRISGNGFGDINDLYVDDIYVTDGTGSANTGELGPIEVVTLLPDGNGNSTVMVGSDGNSTDNYLLVDENPPNETDYVGSDTEGDKDTYAMGDLTGTPVVAGVVASYYAEKTDTGAKYMRPVTRTASTDYVGDSEGLAEGYTLHEHTWDENPNTTSAWTYGEVNGAEFGVEVRDS